MRDVVPSCDLSALRKIRPWEYVVRFAFGGAVTVCTGLLVHAYGPRIGGLFLAFPAILPASLTLLKQHDGREQAVQAVAGARLGAAALIVFAEVTLWLARDHSAAETLALASVGWGLASVALWAMFYGRSR
jgi:Protein of unknown function (DUF3147)